MIQRISSFSIGQTAKVAGVLYFIMGLVLIPFFVLSVVLSPSQSSGIGLGLALAVPLLYGVGGFVFTVIGCALYNLVAKRVGGIEFRVLTTEQPASVSRPVDG